MRTGRPRKYATATQGNLARRAGYKARNLCSNCGQVRDRPPLLRCAKCEAACRTSRRTAWVQAGRCANCGRPRDTQSPRCVTYRASDAQSRQNYLAYQQSVAGRLTTPKLPFYPPAKNVILTYPPILPGSMALIMARLPMGQA